MFNCSVIQRGHEQCGKGSHAEQLADAKVDMQIGVDLTARQQQLKDEWQCLVRVNAGLETCAVRLKTLCM